MSTPIASCGTPAAYRRHLRRKEPTCAECRAAHVTDVTEARRRPPTMPRDLLPCGTEAAYRRHRRQDERPCFRCRVAHAGEAKARYQPRRSA